MSALEFDQLDCLNGLKNGDYNVIERMMLECEINGNGKNKVFTALNDITMSGMYSSICDFKIFEIKEESEHTELTAQFSVLLPDLPHTLFQQADLL